MNIERPNASDLTAEQQQQLEKLTAVVERAIADGKINRQEVEDIKAILWADGKVLPQELEVIRTKILNKLGQEGGVDVDWS
jgi:hypothetical protein